MTDITLPKAFEPLFKPSRYKAYYGGRGSAKSHSFAAALVLMAASKPLRILCAREIQKSIKDSVKRLIDDKIKACGLEGFYESTDTEIRGKNGSLFLFAGLKTNPESIKSMEGIDVAWIEEASRVSQRSLDFLIPTIRKDDSEIWFSWNPENELDPVDMMFRGKTPPPDSVVQRVSWLDNPWFSEVLKKEMAFDQETNPEKFNYVWGGGYMTIQEGAYYSKQIATAIAENRITRVPYDSNSPVYAAFDLGISDSTSIWFAQYIGQEIHIIDFLESNGQPIDWYVKELRARPYVYEHLILPHDARARALGTGKTIEEVLRGFNFQTVICPNIPIIDGINTVRAAFGKCWFDAEKCSDGLKFLRAYRENYDDKLRISRGALHDENSHAADAFRYLCVGRKDPNIGIQRQQKMLEAAQAYVAQAQTTNDKKSSLVDYYRKVNSGSSTKSF